jgi:tRNA pseudouridine38-40 synthase
MNNYLLKIQYDGTNYAGWQIQENAITIQQKIVDAVNVILKEKVNLIGSGRTDSGVHAFGQVANFKTELELDIYKFQFQLNSVLPNDISILEMKKVDESFHARFDAKSRTYIYLFSHKKSPFYKNYSYQFSQIVNYDFNYLNNISKVLIGKKDFTSFSKKNTEVDDKNCNISEICWSKRKLISIFYITADRFLHGMVRTIIGTLLYAGEKKFDEKDFIEIFEKKNREEAEQSVPAKGLFLFKVRY